MYSDLFMLCMEFLLSQVLVRTHCMEDLQSMKEKAIFVLFLAFFFFGRKCSQFFDPPEGRGVLISRIGGQKTFREPFFRDPPGSKEFTIARCYFRGHCVLKPKKCNLPLFFVILENGDRHPFKLQTSMFITIEISSGNQTKLLFMLHISDCVGA